MQQPRIRSVEHGHELIFVGQGLLEILPLRVKALLPHITRFVVITDSNLDRLYGERLQRTLLGASLPFIYKGHPVLPPGEQTKSRQVKEEIEDWMFKERCNRDTCIIAFGGGVIGDLSGFVAATFVRGIPFVQVPTTLLAMVDSSIGGKTGIDTPAGKNLLGAFHHPRAIFIDTAFLYTLPDREFFNGMAEVIKIAAVRDAQLFELVENCVDKLCERNPELLEEVLIRAAELKAKITSIDANEKGIRCILNWGHTIGHAIEALVSPRLLHGECVAIGIVLEAKLSHKLGYLATPTIVGRIIKLLQSYRLPTQLPPDLDFEALLQKMTLDKKNAQQRIRCVILQTIGHSFESPVPVPSEALRQVLLPAVSLTPKQVNGTVAVPGSKSISNRALLLAALGQGECRIKGLLHADDTHVCLDALQQLGVTYSWENDGQTLRVVGTGGRFRPPQRPLFLGNAGTASRFLTTMCTLITGAKTIITGVQRLQERPIRDLTDALQANGCKITFLEKEGFFPFEIQGTGLPGGTIHLQASVSSQFVSSILMIAPRYAQKEVELRVSNPVSLPYIEMTLQVMQQFGITAQMIRKDTYRIPRGVYKNPPFYEIEADASSASYPLAMAAITGGTVTVSNMGSASLQGDARFCTLLQAMGCEVHQTPTSTTVRGPPGGRLRPIDVDMSTMTDTFMTASVLAAVASGRSRIYNIANQRVKESDRIAAMVKELSKCGIAARELEDGLEIEGMEASKIKGASIECYKDHRIAMSFAVLGVRVPGIVVTDKECVDKTYPEFWMDLEQRFKINLEAHSVPRKLPDKKSAAAASAGTSCESQRSVLITGMRGSGKTHMGTALAHKLGRQFFDLDAVFESKHGPIAVFVQRKGWRDFREKEADVLAEVLSANQKGAVISTGGGVVETGRAREVLQRWPGLRIQLTRPIEDVVAYLSSDTSRPSLGAEVKDLWNKRRPLYIECTTHEFVIRRGETDWTKTEEEFVRFTRRLLSPLPPLPPAPSFFLCLTFPDLALVVELLPRVTEGVDAVELRVDLLSSTSADFVAQQIALLRRHCSLPIIYTVRSKDQGGAFQGTEEQMLSLLQLGARLGCEYIDVECALSAPRLMPFLSSISSTARTIGSYHFYSEQPTRERLRSHFLKCSQYPVDIVKVVGFAHHIEDCFVLRQVVREVSDIVNRPIIALLAGDQGRLSRVFNLFLTPVTHPLLPLKAAPGQLSAAEILAQRKALGMSAAL